MLQLRGREVVRPRIAGGYIAQMRNAQSGRARRPSQLPLLPHYGNASSSRIRWELSFGGHHSPSPNTIFGKARKITPSRQANSAVKMRERVSPDEVERLIVAARQVSDGRLAEPDALLIMMAYRHGLRASGIDGLRWNQIDLKAQCSIHVLDARTAHPRDALGSVVGWPASEYRPTVLSRCLF
jgi:integrase